MLIGEKGRYGLASILAYKCSGCGQTISFATSTRVNIPSGGKYWSCNVAAVWGQMATGGGFNHLEESLGILGVPVMSKQSFVTTEQTIGKWWWDLFNESTLAAGNRERELAIQENSYHEGVPAITVVVDAGWSKRTHKHTYNALSAVGVIFGQKTGKLLYMGVRNKYCSVCKKGNPTKTHTCFKNWTGASSSMESDLILEGFLAAEKQHGVRYINFIGDGDSSVYSTLVSNVPGWGYSIKKQECANHALKCYRASLEQLIKDKPSYKGKHKLTENMRLRLTKAARCAIIMRSKESDKHKAAVLLQEDIMNSPMHCFGSHHKCKPDYCKVVRVLKNNGNNTDNISQSIPNLHSSGMSNTPNCQSTDSADTSLSSTCSSTSTLDSNISTDCVTNASDDSYEILELSADSEDCGYLETEIENVDEFLQEQGTAWQDATAPATDSDATDPVTTADTTDPVTTAVIDSDATTVSLDPPHPIDHQIICDIKSIASRLASKAHQKLGE